MALTDLLARLGIDVQPFSSALDGALKDLDRFGKSAETKFQGLERLGGNLQSLGSSLSLGVTAPLMAIAGLGVSASANLDSLTRGLTAVAGSSEAASRQLESLRVVAKLPGLGFEEAVRGSINLQAAGFSAGIAERALMAFGNALATVGKGRAELDGVVTALSQIASKGKISAEEINQLAERVPQIRQIMKDAFGTADTEILQKAKIPVEQFVESIIEELEKLPPVTGGLANSFENVKDKASQAFAKIGDILAPMVVKFLDAVDPLLDKLISLAQWFGDLPIPIQLFVGSLVALAAAAGPVLFALGSMAIGVSTVATALTPLVGTLEISSLALGGWVAAIGVGVAALVSLTKAVADYRSAQDDLAAANKTQVDGLAKLEVSLKQQGADISAVQREYKTGLITYDQYMRKLQDVAKALGDAKKATGENTTAHASAKPKIDAVALAHKEVTEKVKARTFGDEVLTEQLKLLQSEHQKTVHEIAALKLHIDKSKTSTTDFAAEAVKLREQFAGMKQDMPDQKILDVVNAMGQAEMKAHDLGTALGTLGVKSATEYSKIAADAKAAYEVIQGSSVATTWEKDNAMLAMLKAQREAMIANSTVIPAEMDKQIKALEEKTKTGLPKVKDQFEAFKNSVSTVITNLAQDITKSLFDGDMSWKEKGITALKGLGQAVVSAFIEPATAAIAKFISGALADLIGGKGFGGVLNRLGDLGTGISNVFGGGGGGGYDVFANYGHAGEYVPKGGGGGLGGGLGAASGGLTSTLGAVGSIGTMVSSIVGNFQFAAMNKSLDLIEKATRYTDIALNGPDGISENIKKIRDFVSQSTDRLIEMVPKIKDIAEGQTDVHVRVMNQSDMGATYQITVQVAGGNTATQTGDAIGEAIVSRLRILRGAYA